VCVCVCVCVCVFIILLFFLFNIFKIGCPFRGNQEEVLTQ
jgi:hypothetical protein